MRHEIYASICKKEVIKKTKLCTTFGGTAAAAPPPDAPASTAAAAPFSHSRPPLPNNFIRFLGVSTGGFGGMAIVLQSYYNIKIDDFLVYFCNTLTVQHYRMQKGLSASGVTALVQAAAFNPKVGAFANRHGINARDISNLLNKL